MIKENAIDPIFPFFIIIRIWLFQRPNTAYFKEFGAGEDGMKKKSLSRSKLLHRYETENLPTIVPEIR